MTTAVDWQRWIAALNAAHDRWTAMQGHQIDGDQADPRPYVPITPNQAHAALVAIAQLGADLEHAANSIATSARRGTGPAWPDFVVYDAARHLGAVAHQTAEQLTDALEKHTG